MKKLILLLESILLYVSFAISQNAIAVCGTEYQLKSGNYDNYNNYTSNPRWVAVSMPDDAHPPYYTGTSDGLYVRVSDYGVYTFVLRENVNGVSFTVETVTVDFIDTPNIAGYDFEVWGLDFQLHAISSHIEGDNITGMWTCISNGTATFEDSTDPQTMVHYSDYGYATFRWTETAYPHIEVANDVTCSAFDDVTVTIMGYVITATSSNPNHGTVTGGGVYDYGTEIQIFAIPTEHYHFVQWNDGNTDNPRTITVTGDATYTAEFAIDQHTIIVETADVEIGVVSEGGTYDYGTEIQIDATPSEGYRFVSWNDGNTENPRTIIVTENSTYIAVFADIVCENPCPIVTNQVMTYTNIPYYVPEGLVYYTNENIDICITIKCPEMTDCVFFSMPATVYIDSLTITSLSNLPNGLSYCVSRVDLNQTTNVYATIHITGTAPSTSGEYELELSGKITGTAGVDGLGYELTDQAVTVATGIVLNIIRPSYIITATAGENGTISPAEATVEEGENASFTIATNEGYRIASVIVDAETENEANVTAQLVEGVYTFENVTANHTIAATFDALPVSDIQVKLYADANGTAEIGTTITLSATDDFTVYPAIFNAGPDGASGIVTFDLQISGASVYGGPQSISLGGYPVPVNYFIITDTRTFTADYMDRLGLTGTFALCFTVAYSGSGYDSDLSNNSLCILVTRTNGEAPTAIISDLEVKVFRDQQMTSEIESNFTVAADEDVVVYPVIFNAGPDVAVGTVNLNVQLDGVSIGEGEITLASQPIAANHSVTITPLIISAALLDQGGITGNFELCFSITYSGNDSDLSNNSLCISVTRTTQLEVDFTTVPAAINGVVTIGVGDVVTFTNRSVYADHVAWTFEGGSPATSTENYVTVTYATAGIYTATLTAYNEDETLIDSKTTTIIVGSAPIYTITATAGENGTITPNGEVMVYEGYDQTFTIAPNEGYRILSVTVDDVDTTTSVIEGVFSFVNVAANHTIAATFEQKPTYTIMVQSSNEEYGTVDGGGTFYEGDEIYITASANHGYRFVQWNDGDTDNPRTITVTEDATYTASFAINQHTITVESNSEAMGTVSESGTYDYGTEIQISATASEHYHFVQWNDGNDDNPRTITVTSDSTFTAVFAINQHTVTVVSADTEMGTVSESGTYDYGTEIQISATPADGYGFVAWNDGNTDNPRTVIVTEDITYTATFGVLRTISVVSADETMGTVQGTGEYVEGATVQITAIPNEHYHFVHWIDEENQTRDFNTDNPRTITVTGNMTYTAVFAIDQHTITVESTDASMGTVSEGGTYDYGTEMQISATASEHYHFVQWNDGNTDNPRTIIVTEDATYRASFAIDRFTITVESADEAMGTVSEGGTYDYGSEIQISATARDGYQFVSWDDGNTDNPRTITVVADATYIASFIPAVGIEEASALEVSLFPNPATDILNITSSETISEIEIVNTLGQVVKRFEVNSDNAVCNVEDLKAGVYVVRIYGNPCTSTGSVSGIMRKFVKE